MFEEPADDAAHADVLAHAGYARTQLAHAADHQFDRDAGLRGAIERLHHAFVADRVELGDDAGRAAGESVFGLALD